MFEPFSDPQLLCVTPRNFGEHLKYLRSHYRIVRLGDLCHALRNGQLPRRAVVITFDDGYVDNLLNAKPLLERYEMPATVFVITGNIGVEGEFWWDEIERLLLCAPHLPERLQITLGGRLYRWDFGEWAQLPEGARSLRKWHVEAPGNPTPRHQAYRELHGLLRRLEREEREAVFAQLSLKGNLNGSGRTDYRAMTRDEIRQLTDGGLIEVGSHTEAHSVLAARSVEVQQREVGESKRLLEAILGNSVTTFSYPYGGIDDVGQDTIQLVRESGYEVACGNIPSPVTKRSDPFFLTRYVVRDWDGEEFARRLRGFFDGSL